jgi:hypothetical protein
VLENPIDTLDNKLIVLAINRKYLPTLALVSA